MSTSPASSVATQYGEVALGRLRRTINELQAHDRLASVAVIVSSNSVGVAARRWLAAHGGVAAVDFVTIYRLAELLGSTALVQAGRRPVSTPVVDVAVRSLLARAPGAFAAVAQHPSTVVAVRDVHRELREVPASSLDPLRRRGSARGRDVIRLHDELTTALAGQWYDEADLVDAAVASLRSGYRPGYRSVVLHLPQRLSPRGQQLLTALAEAVELRVIEGVTAAVDGDEVIHRRLGAWASSRPDTVVAPPVASVVDASDADEEVREAVRIVATAARRGVPFDRMAVVWPASTPYARLLEEHLDAAGIGWNGRPGRAAHEQLAPRLLLDLMDLDRRGLRRSALFAFLSHVPGRDRDGRRIPVHRWQRIAREAGVVRGEDWGPRLRQYRHRLEVDAVRFEGGPSAIARIGDEIDALEAFVADLAGALGPREQPRRWSAWATWCHRQLERWLGGHRGMDDLPAAEREALETIQAVLDRLGRLDAVDGPVPRPVFREALAAELDAAPRRVRRLGDGVHIGPLAFALGLSLELLVVLGASEGQLPAPPAADPLLGDGDRQLTGGVLATSSERSSLQHHQLFAAISGAAEAHLLRPRGDLRANAELHASRWIAPPQRDAAADQLVADAHRCVDSFASGMEHSPFPVTAQQHRVRSLAATRRSGLAIDDHRVVADDRALASGLRLLRARATTELTDYDGFLPTLGLPAPGTGATSVSPSRLEQWAACPFGYFARYVLHVEPLREVDDQLRIDPAGRGTWLHAVLDRFHRSVIDGTLPQPGRLGWGPRHREALLAHFDDEAAQLEATGAVGRPVFWHVERARQRRVLERWLQADSELAIERDTTVVSSELSFGIDGTAPAAVRLADGRVLAMRGKVDRIDRSGDGSLVVVDHKTGSAYSYAKLGAADPTAGGTKVQLPAYAAAALAATGAAGTGRVRAEYSFTERGDYKRIGYELTESVWDLVGAHLQRIVDGIEAGIFVPLPAKPAFLPFTPCEYCDPDHLGTAHIWNEHVVKRADPRLRAALAIADDHAVMLDA